MAWILAITVKGNDTVRCNSVSIDFKRTVDPVQFLSILIKKYENIQSGTGR